MPTETLEKPAEMEESGADEEGEEGEEGGEEGERAPETSGLKMLGPGIIMLFVAISLDVVGLILAIFGVTELFSYIPDVIGLVFIGGWSYFNSQTVKVTSGASAKLTKAGKWAKRMKWLRPLMIVGEFIPFVGALPCWTLLVIFELQG